MNGFVSLNPEQLDAVSTRFSDVGAEISRVIREDGQRLDDAGQPWGNDEEGEAFARVYEPAAEAVMHALVKLALSIPQIGVGIREMATTATVHEHNLAGQLGAPPTTTIPAAAGADPVPAAGGRSGLLNASVGAAPPSAIELALNPHLYSQTITDTPENTGGQR